MKGAQYVLRWGLSLPYVPLGLKKPLRYGRTLKSARLSMRWGSHRDETEPGPEHRGFIDTFLGLRCVRDDAQTVWLASRPAAVRFWERTQDLPGVLDVATELMTAPGARNWGTPLVGAVASLTASRMGLLQQAREYAAATPLPEDQATILADLIERQHPGRR